MQTSIKRLLTSCKVKYVQSISGKYHNQPGLIHLKSYLVMWKLSSIKLRRKIFEFKN